MDFLRALTIIAVLVGVSVLPVLIAWMVIATDDTERSAAPPPRPRRSLVDSMDRLDRIREQLRRLPLDAVDSRTALAAQYDLELRRASSRLDIEHRLTELEGVDLELERVRVTEALSTSLAVEGRGLGEAP